MSLLDELTAELCGASEALPVPALRRAVVASRHANEHLRSAARALERTGTLEPILARLGSATAHLESGAGLIMRAQDEVNAYVVAIGGRRFAPVTPGIPEAEPVESWWARRIAQLTAESGPGCDDPAGTATELLVRIGRTVVAHDRAGLHRQLVGAGAGVGSSLAPIAASALRRFATDLLGHPPGPSDSDALRRRAQVHDLLPGLPGGVTDTLLGHACHVPQQASHHDPTDLAVAAAVLTARFADAAGRAPEQLDA